MKSSQATPEHANQHAACHSRRIIGRDSALVPCRQKGFWAQVDGLTRLRAWCCSSALVASALMVGFAPISAAPVSAAPRLAASVLLDSAVVSLNATAFGQEKAPGQSSEKADETPKAGAEEKKSRRTSWFNFTDRSLAVRGGATGAYLGAMTATVNGDADRAASLFSKALARDPLSSHLQTRAFYQYLDLGRLGQAAEAADRLIVGRAQAREPLMLQVAALGSIKARRWDRAQQRLTQWQDAGSRNLIGQLMALWVAAAQGDRASVDAMLGGMMARPGLAASMAREHRAYVYDYMGAFDEARTSYDALMSGPNARFVQPYVQYVRFIERTEGRDAAREKVIELRDRFSRSPLFEREVAAILKGGELGTNAAEPRGALTLLFNRVANELAGGDDNRSTIIYLRFAAYLSPDNADTQVFLASQLEDIEDFDGAIKAYASVSAKHPFYEAGLVRRVQLMMRQEDDARAEALAEQAIRNGLGGVEMLLARADLKRARDDLEGALSDYQTIIDAAADAKSPDQTLWYPHFASAVILDGRADWAAAEQHLEAALVLAPKRAEVQNYLGYSWVDRGIHMDQGRALIEQAVKSEPDNGAYQDSLGWVYFKLGDYEKAIKHLERAVHLEPADVEIADHLGDVYWKVGRLIEARYQWQHAKINGAEGDKLDEIEDKMSNGLHQATAALTSADR